MSSSSKAKLDEICHKLRRHLIAHQNKDGDDGVCCLSRLLPDVKDRGDSNEDGSSRSSSPCPSLNLSMTTEDEGDAPPTPPTPPSSSSSPSSTGSLRLDMPLQLQEASRTLFDVNPLVVRLVPVKTNKAKTTKRDLTDLDKEEVEKMPVPVAVAVAVAENEEEWCHGWDDGGEAVMAERPPFLFDEPMDEVRKD